MRILLFGDQLKLNNNMTLTYCVTKYYLRLRNNMLQLNSGKDPSVIDLRKIIATDIEKIWNNASIPTISHQQV